MYGIHFMKYCCRCMVYILWSIVVWYIFYEVWYTFIVVWYTFIVVWYTFIVVWYILYELLEQYKTTQHFNTQHFSTHYWLELIYWTKIFFCVTICLVELTFDPTLPPMSVPTIGSFPKVLVLKRALQYVEQMK